jgi:hypothetical protein
MTAMADAESLPKLAAMTQRGMPETRSTAPLPTPAMPKMPMMPKEMVVGEKGKKPARKPKPTIAGGY